MAMVTTCAGKGPDRMEGSTTARTGGKRRRETFCPGSSGDWKLPVG